MTAEAPVKVKGLTARDLLRTAVLVVDGHESVELVWSRFQQERCERAVVMAADGRLGVVELQDLWVRWAVGLDGATGQVLQLASPAPVVAESAPLLEVCQALRTTPRGVVLVQAEDGTLLGVLTAADVVRGLTEVISS